MSRLVDDASCKLTVTRGKRGELQLPATGTCKVLNVLKYMWITASIKELNYSPYSIVLSLVVPKFGPKVASGGNVCKRTGVE